MLLWNWVAIERPLKPTNSSGKIQANVSMCKNCHISLFRKNPKGAEVYEQLLKTCVALKRKSMVPPEETKMMRRQQNRLYRNKHNRLETVKSVHDSDNDIAETEQIDSSHLRKRHGDGDSSDSDSDSDHNEGEEQEPDEGQDAKINNDSDVAHVPSTTIMLRRSDSKSGAAQVLNSMSNNESTPLPLIRRQSGIIKKRKLSVDETRQTKKNYVQLYKSHGEIQLDPSESEWVQPYDRILSDLSNMPPIDIFPRDLPPVVETLTLSVTPQWNWSLCQTKT